MSDWGPRVANEIQIAVHAERFVILILIKL